jgi:transcriptional regulator with XRE-family HTH domain
MTTGLRDDNSTVIVGQEAMTMKLSDMKTHEELVAEQLRDDPEFRAEWERTALARAVAVTLVRHRADHGMSQRDVAGVLAMKQPQVARLERGEVNPSMEMLMRISAGLGIEFTIDVRPSKAKARLVTKKAQTENAVGVVETEHADVLVAAAQRRNVDPRTSSTASLRAPARATT